MKQRYKICLLTCLLCGMMTSAKAETGDIINEDFSGFTGLIANSATIIRDDGWTIHGIQTRDGAYSGTIIFEYINSTYKNSYVITPTFSKLNDIRNAVMSFRFSNMNSNHASFSVTINGGGTFPNGKNKWEKTITSNSNNFKTETLKLVGVSAATSVTFKLTSTGEKYYFALDDVVISTADGVTLTDDAANSLVTKVADVTVGRTLAAGVWNTLCLPFNAGKNTIAQATGNAVDGVSLRTFSGFSEDVLTFAAVDTVTAGTPFLVKLAQAVESPTFPLVELKGNITAETRTVTYNGASMIGIFDPTDIGSSGLFLTASGELKRASGSSTTLKGLRAYFTVPAGTTQARLVLDDGATVIDMVETAPADNRWYAPDGRRYNTQPTRRGIYIKDGKKVIIR